MRRQKRDRSKDIGSNTHKYCLNYSNLQNSWQKRRGGETAQGKAKDAGGLTPVKDGNAVLCDCCPLLPTNFCREF